MRNAFFQTPFLPGAWLGGLEPVQLSDLLQQYGYSPQQLTTEQYLSFYPRPFYLLSVTIRGNFCFAAGMTQKEVAGRMHVNRSYVA